MAVYSILILKLGIRISLPYDELYDLQKQISCNGTVQIICSSVQYVFL